jgi:hypothetical protein
VVALACLLLTQAGCTGKAATVETFNDFKAAVNNGNFDEAFGMLTESSKAKFDKKASNFKAVLESGDAESLMKTAFGEDAEIRNTKASGDAMQTGEIHRFNADQKDMGQSGAWSIIKEGEDWKIDWRLDTQPRQAGASGAPKN